VEDVFAIEQSDYLSLYEGLDTDRTLFLSFANLHLLYALQASLPHS
jgi:hypothetical protein